MNMARLKNAVSFAAALLLAPSFGGLALGQPLDADGCITDFDPAADYFPVKTDLTDAVNFTVTYHRSY
jgi:iron complex transport system substrate-binding protein